MEASVKHIGLTLMLGVIIGITITGVAWVSSAIAHGPSGFDVSLAAHQMAHTSAEQIKGCLSESVSLLEALQSEVHGAANKLREEGL